jgi:hypothetical protein
MNPIFTLPPEGGCGKLHDLDVVLVGAVPVGEPLDRATALVGLVPVMRL